MQRKPISKKVRFEVFKRDHFTCTYCGKKPPETILELDHILAVAQGGDDAIDNLTTACLACNSGKSDRPLGQIAPNIDELAVLQSVQEMLERQVLLKGQMKAVEAQKKAEDEAVVTVISWWLEAFGNVDGLQESSIARFVQLLPLDQIREALFITMTLHSEKPWKPAGQLWSYFCGTCWGMIRKLPGSGR